MEAFPLVAKNPNPSLSKSFITNTGASPNQWCCSQALLMPRTAAGAQTNLKSSWAGSVSDSPELTVHAVSFDFRVSTGWCKRKEKEHPSACKLVALPGSLEQLCDTSLHFLDFCYVWREEAFCRIIYGWDF